MVANMPEHVFISYHHADGDFADYLRMKLKESGLDVWLDEAALTAGDDWRAEIDQAIKGASSLVVIMTADAKASDYVTYEWAFAIGAGIKVIPILLKETELHPRLESFRYLDFTDRKARPWDDMINALKEKGIKEPRRDSNSIPGTAYCCTIGIPNNVPNTFKDAVIKLDSTDADERRKAIAFISEYDHSAAHEVLLSALKHPLVDVRLGAIQGLESTCDENVLPDLLNLLVDKSSSVRGRTVVALGKIKNRSTVPDVINALNDKEGYVRTSAAWALGEIADAKAVPALINAFNVDIGKNDMETVEFAKIVAGALTNIKDLSTFSELMNALRKSKVEISGCIAGVILEIVDAIHMPELISALSDQDPRLRAYSAWILGELKVLSAVSSLIKLLSDNADSTGLVIWSNYYSKRYRHYRGLDNKVCKVAAEALHKIGTPDALSALENWRIIKRKEEFPI